MFTRWNQENFFKYMVENFDFDRMIEYGTQELSNTSVLVVNSEYKKISYHLKKTREKRARLQAKLFQKMAQMEDISSEQMEKKIRENAKTVQLMEDYGLLINDLTGQRKQMPAKIKLSEMPEQYRFNKLKEEIKKCSTNACL